MTPPATPDDGLLASLAEEYLALVGMTDAGEGNPDDRSHTAAARAVVHDQILAYLGLTRADAFDPIAWAKELLARRQPPVDPYADLPFEHNQPLERYRLHHGKRLADFVTFLGVTEADYLRLITGDRDIPPELTRSIARRLGVPPWLVNECTPPLSAEQLGQIAAAGARADQEGWYEYDEATGETIGPILSALEPPRPPRLAIPEAHYLLADALAKLVKVHADGADPDYPALRAYLDQRIRGALGLTLDTPFDIERWADELTEGALTRARG